MATKLLLTDASNPLGAAIAHALEVYPYNVVMPEPGQVDWNDASVVADYLQKQKPAILINTLGWSSLPSVAEQLLLVTAAKHLMLACEAHEVVPIHLSSVRVFGGENKSAYDERDTPSPINAEGRAYLEAERCFEKLKRHINLRLSWLLDANKDSLVDRYLGSIMADADVTFCDHHRGSPTHVSDVARVIAAMIPQILHGAENWGTFHYAANEPVSELELVQVLAQLLKDRGDLLESWQPIIRAVTEDDHISSEVLTVRRCMDNFGIQGRGWRKGLKPLVALLRERD